MIYQIIPPPEILKRWVRHFWVLQFSSGHNDEKLLKLYADPYPLLTFQCNEGESLIRKDDGTFLSDFFIAGIKTKPVSFKVSSTYSQVAVSFYPNAIGKIFDVPPDAFVDRYYDLIDLCPKLLVEKLRNSKDIQERIHHLIEFLITQTKTVKKRDPILEDCVFGRHDLKEWNLKSLMNGHKISERQLERKFNEYMGISPKRYLRIIRFERALKMLQCSSSGKLSNVAFDLGYSDQAAFSNDFRNSCGFSPNLYLATGKVVEYESSFVQQ